MRAAVIIFPGSNCDRDVYGALKASIGSDPIRVWHNSSELPKVDLVVVPGGFSYGDYLRSGAIAARSPIMQEVKRAAGEGVHVLGICNGFQILTEAGLLPGTLLRNKHLKFICRDVHLKVEQIKSAFTGAYEKDQVIRMGVAHHDGNYYADEATLGYLQDKNLIAFRYSDDRGNTSDAANPNGSRLNIAGILNKEKNVLGLMPHPERHAEAATGGTDGKYMFDCLVNCLS